MPDDDHAPLSGDLTAVFYYDVGELYVRRDQLGDTISTQRDGHDVRVTFPRYRAFGSNDPRFDSPRAPRDRATTGSHGDEDDPSSKHVVAIVQVSVDLNRGLDGDDAGDLLRGAEPIAAATVRGMLDWVRIHGHQPWLPPPHIRPTQAGAANLVNAAGEESRGHAMIASVIVLHDELPAGDMRHALTETSIPEADSLLAEARQAIWPKNDPDTKRAVLLATIALEVKCPEVLLGRAKATARELLSAIYKRHDEAPLSVNFQLTALAEVILGESLKTHDGHLLKRVKNLVELRNGVAHRGEEPPAEATYDGVAAAEQVFQWLASHAAAPPTVDSGPSDTSALGIRPAEQP